MNFLQTQQAQIYAGIIISLVTLMAFAFIYLRRMRKNVFMLPSRKECSLLTAKNWFTLISDSIEYSANIYELERTMEKIETFRKKKFRFSITRAERRNYIDNLLVLYCEKEIELQTPIRVELCPQ